LKISDLKGVKPTKTIKPNADEKNFNAPRKPAGGFHCFVSAVYHRLDKAGR